MSGWRLLSAALQILALLVTLSYVTCTGIPNFPKPLGMWPLNRMHKDSDVGDNRATIAFSNVEWSDDCPFSYDHSGSVEFLGVSNSHGIISNTNGRYSPAESFTFIAWIKPLGSSGPMFTFYPDSTSCSHGLLFWNLGVYEFHYNSMHSSMYGYTGSNTIAQNTWNRVAVTYDYSTGYYKIFINGAEYRSQRKTAVGQQPVAQSNYKIIRMGSCPSDARYLKARMYCMQWYDEALTVEQLDMAFTLCRIHDLPFYPWPIPLGHWPLNVKHGNADISGRANHAIFKEISYDMGVDGTAGGSVRLNYSSDSYIDLSNSNSYLNFEGSHTISFWAYVANGDNGWSPLFVQAAQTDNTAADASWLRHIGIRNSDDGVISKFNNIGQAHENVINTRRQWNWYLFSADQSEGVESVYINGELAATSDISSYPTPLPTNRDFRIGKEFYSSQDVRFHGRITCLQMYDFPISAENLHLIQERCIESDIAEEDIENDLAARFPLTSDLSDLISGGEFVEDGGGEPNTNDTSFRGADHGFALTTKNNKQIKFLWSDLGNPIKSGTSTATMSFWFKINELVVDLSTKMFIASIDDQESYSNDWYILHHGGHCSPNVIDGIQYICLHGRINSAPDSPVSTTPPKYYAGSQIPLHEFENHWRHIVLTGNTEYGSSQVYVDGLLAYNNYMGFGKIWTDGTERFEFEQNTKRDLSINCLQFYNKYVTKRDVVRMRDACIGDNKNDLVKPIAFWALDHNFGYKDISEVSALDKFDLITTDISFAPGFENIQNMSSQFNGAASFAITPRYDTNFNFKIAFSLLVWIYPQSYVSGVGPIIATSNDSVTLESVYSLYNEGSDITFTIRWLSGTVTSIRSNQLKLDEWNSVSVILDDQYSAIELYVNGDRHDRMVLPSHDVVDNLYDHRLVIGSGIIPGHTDRKFFTGRLACVQIYNYALTDKLRKQAENFCQYKSSTRTLFKKHTGNAPADDYVIATSRQRNVVQCMASCTQSQKCMSATYYETDKQCDLHSITIWSSGDNYTSMFTTSADHYYEVEHLMKREGI